MTGRTHDLAAFTALSGVIATHPMPHISLATAIVALSANLLGGIAPDIDQPTAALWRRLPVGTVAGKIVQPLLGGHRYISHSLIGVWLFGTVLHFALNELQHVLLVDMSIVWWAFMIGFWSHLIMDTFTREGVPWLFPIPFRFGIPPFHFLRIKTGGVVEKSFVFPALLIVNIYLYYRYYRVFLAMFHSLK